MSICFAKRPARAGRPVVRRCPTVEGLGGRVVLSTFGSIATALNTAAEKVASYTGPGDEGPEEQITFVYGQLGVTYWPQN
jgi:hypothetical protein